MRPGAWDSWLRALLVLGYGLAALLALVGLVVVVVILAGCSAAPKPLVTTRVVVEPHVVRCASTPPPTPTPLPRPACDAQGCRWSLAQAAALADNVEALLAWVATTWTLCSPAPASQPIGVP